MKYIFFLIDVYESWKELGTMDVTFRTNHAWHIQEML